jgi:phosphatidylserine decarboxylase
MKKYQITLQDALLENPDDFPDFNSFFTRELKPGARIIANDENAIISPVDGTISQIGKIVADQLIQVKNFNYNLSSLLGDEKIAGHFQNGNFATIYLAPKNYHRVHMPISGKLNQMFYIPGDLFSVNNDTAENVPNLFTRNERVVTNFDTEIGKMVVVLVGAIIVGNIETMWAGTINPRHEKNIVRRAYNTENIFLNRGAEMGRFKLGSTVIVLFQENKITWQDNIIANTTVQMGQQLGKCV